MALLRGSLVGATSPPSAVTRSAPKEVAMLILSLLTCVALGPVAATAPSPSEAADVKPQILTAATWEVVDREGRPVQDAARIAVLRAMVDQLQVPMTKIPAGTNLVACTYAEADSSQPATAESAWDPDRLEQLETDRGSGGYLQPRRRAHEVGTVLSWRGGDGSCRFVARRWGYEAIRIELPKVKDRIIDVGILRPAPVPTFTQVFHIVNEAGELVDRSGPMTLRLNGSPVRHPGTLEHGVATFTNVPAGPLLLEGELPGYELDRRDTAWVTAAPGVIPKVVAKRPKPVQITVDPAWDVAETPTAEHPWYTRIGAAKAAAAATKKPLMLYFTSTDACGWCTRLHEEVFDTPEFLAWAQEHVILVEVNFLFRSAQEPTLKQQNESLAKLFDIHGYPHSIFLDPSGTQVLGHAEGYRAGGPSPWIAKAMTLLSAK